MAVVRGIGLQVGANYQDGNCEFRVWAPYSPQVKLLLTQEGEALAMEKEEKGYWKLAVDGIKPNTQYRYQLTPQNSKPDPASHFQPQGGFEPSAVVDHEAHTWKDKDWQGIPRSSLVMYELHVGTFTAEGTFEAAEGKVKELAELGVNALELMPVAQFSGNRNWGYDAVFPYAVQNTYGGPEALKRLVEHCHRNDIAVFLDVVYNHLGPEGNCFGEYGPYFLEERRTPWGWGMNFDGADCGQVRDFFFENALHWFGNYHVDGLRLDAVHAILDTSPKHFLKELAEVAAAYAEKTSRKVLLIAESNQNNPTLVRSRASGGYGLDAVWLDDFHHALHVMLTKEKEGYYVDFGGLADLAKALREGFVYSGQYSQFWSQPRGQPSKDISPGRFVAFSQNHDQIGNRMLGERLISLAGRDAAKLAAGLVAFSAYVPLFFMGEEYGEQAPFLFFTSFSDRQLGENVREGRKNDVVAFNPQEELPDPQSVDTFNMSKLQWQRRYEGAGAAILGYYGELLRLRKLVLAAMGGKRMVVQVPEEGNLLFMQTPQDSACGVVANFDPQQRRYKFPFTEGTYAKRLDSADARFAGPGATLPDKAALGEEQLAQPFNFAVYVNSELVNKP